VCSRGCASTKRSSARAREVTEPVDIEAERIAASFKPRWRAIGIGVGANLVAISLLLGVPYVRGRSQALEQRVQFADFARCLFGGEVPASPGLALPRGERDHFAGKFASAPREWPLSCRKPLRALAPAPAIFLWPAVKRAGADLRAVVELLDKELVGLQHARSQGAARIPTRPLDLLAKLQAALTLMVKAADVAAGMDDDVLRFVRPPPLAAPARLPLNADATAQLHLTSAGGALEVTALDNRGLSWLRLDAGKIDHQRVKRVPLVRSVVHARGEPYVVWAMPAARCREREDRCARRACGIARYDTGAESMPSPLWLAGHPAGRPDRALRVSSTGVVDMLAVTDTPGRLTLARFDPSHAPQLTTAVPGTADEAPPRPASASVSIAPTELQLRDALLLDTQPHAVAAAGTRGASLGAAVLWASSAPSRAPLWLGGLPEAATQLAWIAACTANGTHWLAYGSDAALRIARMTIVAETPQLVESTALQARITAPFDEEDPARDRLRLVCDEQQAWIFLQDADDTLQVTRCDALARCSPPRALARETAAFAALLVTARDVAAVVAYARRAPHRELRVLRLTTSTAPIDASVMPAACWDPFGGMCGMPTLALDGQRVLLAARDGLDLLIVESNDAGSTFASLSGFRMGTAFDPSGSAPLLQHRIRKGIR
jgi:hypothetical protein